MDVLESGVVFLQPGSYDRFAVLMPLMPCRAATACVKQKAAGAVSQGQGTPSVTSLLSRPSPLRAVCAAVPGQGARRGTHGTQGCRADVRSLKDAAFRP